MSNRWGNMETVRDFIFGAPKSLQMVTAAMKLKDACSLEWRVMINLNSILKSRDIILPTKVHLVKALVFPIVMYGCDSWTIKKAKELMLLNCGAGEDFWESLGLQGDLKPVYPKANKSWIFIGKTDAEAETLNTLATWCEELTHLKKPWCWERLKGGGEGDDRGWDGWMVSLTGWTKVLASSRSWWWTRKPDMLQSMGFQRVWHDWATELWIR